MRVREAITHKRCSDCKRDRPVAAMVKNSSSPDGYHNLCREHMAQRGNKHYHASGVRFRRHGITETDYNAMLETQGGLCAICAKRPVEHIDHDHRTGLVRGLLCRRCNTALGVFDAPDTLERLNAYLKP